MKNYSMRATIRRHGFRNDLMTRYICDPLNRKNYSDRATDIYEQPIIRKRSCKVITDKLYQTRDRIER
jgi:hypothetical protein